MGRSPPDMKTASKSPPPQNCGCSSNWTQLCSLSSWEWFANDQHFSVIQLVPLVNCLLAQSHCNSSSYNPQTTIISQLRASCWPKVCCNCLKLNPSWPKLFFAFRCNSSVMSLVFSIVHWSHLILCLFSCHVTVIVGAEGAVSVESLILSEICFK